MPAVTVEPTVGVPEIAGGTVLAGGRTTVSTGEYTSGEEPAAFVAVTSTRT